MLQQQGMIKKEGSELLNAFTRAISQVVSDVVKEEFSTLIKDRKLIIQAQPEISEEESEEFWTIDQFCDYVHVSKPTYYSFVHRGLIHPHKCGQRTLISSAEVKAKLKSGELGG